MLGMLRSRLTSLKMNLNLVQIGIAKHIWLKRVSFKDIQYDQLVGFYMETNALKYKSIKTKYHRPFIIKYTTRSKF